MANPERIAALQEIRASRTQVDAARVQGGLSPQDRSALDKVALRLDDLEDTLAVEELGSCIAAITADAADLHRLATEIQAANAALAKDIARVEQAARAVDGLVKAITAAAGL